ncbi:MAG TPA: hypothetical protein PLX66_00725 [Bacilli bacterium]|nr:hypothetical protein [Bacilli bacterium]
MKLKRKQVYSLISALLILLIGVILLSFKDLLSSANTLFYIVMYVVAAIKLVEYFVTKEKGDYENLLITMVSVIAGTAGIVFNFKDTPLVLSITLISWVSMLAIIKLIKVDYLMDRKNKMWYAEIITLGIFILVGILTSINLYFSSAVQTLMLGFFFLIMGILEVIYPLLDSFAKKNKNKE